MLKRERVRSDVATSEVMTGPSPLRAYDESTASRAVFRQRPRPAGSEGVSRKGAGGQSSSISVRRGDRSVVVTVRGDLDRIASLGLRHILSDLVEGQGNLFVRVDFDVAAQATVFAVLAGLESPSSDAGQIVESVDYGSVWVRGFRSGSAAGPA